MTPSTSKKLCHECEKHPGEFTITPIYDNGKVYIRKEAYHLCRSCFLELTKKTCSSCGSDEIIHNHELAIKYCNNCGNVTGRIKNRSHKERRDYKINEPDESDF